MQSNSKIRLFLFAAAAIIAIGIVIHFSGRAGKTTVVELTPTNSTSRPEIRSYRSGIGQPKPQSAETSSDEAIREDGLPAIPREKVEDYLRENHRNVSSLLAAFHALNDTNYLYEAATNFPTDPQLQWTLLARNVFPEERRKWLDAFKASSPDNSLANYLSAQEYFKSGQTKAALEELEIATGKKQFKDYAVEASFNAEELSSQAGLDGRMSLTMGMAAAASDLLPYLANFKSLGRDIADLQKQTAAAGDQQLAVVLPAMGLSLAKRLQEGDGAKFLINQLVGNAMQAIAMESLDQNMTYDYLGGQTPAQQLAAMKERRAEFRKLQEGLTSALVTLSDAEWSAFAQRQKIYGEVEAMRWLQQRMATANKK